jgi:hypothetical protein
MKIKVTTRQGREVALDVFTSVTGSTPVGNSYYAISYRLGGEVVHTAASGCRSTRPSPIEALNWSKDVEAPCGKEDPGAAEVRVHGRPSYYARRESRTQLDLLLDALELVVIDGDAGAHGAEAGLDGDGFLEAARPLMEWLGGNARPHMSAQVTSVDAQLLEAQLRRVAPAG